MDLGIINGASEGTISVAIVFLLTALYGKFLKIIFF
jgi:hypothetical protein